MIFVCKSHGERVLDSQAILAIDVGNQDVLAQRLSCGIRGLDNSLVPE
jgi:hypothetical protein